MENYTAYYFGVGRMGLAIQGYEQYSFFAQDNAAARHIADDFSWRFNHSSWSGPTIGLEKIVEKDGGKVVFEATF